MSASSPPRHWRKAYPSFERRVVSLLGPRMAWLLVLLDGHSQNYRLTNAQLAKELGVSVVYIEKLLSRARRLGLIQSDGKPRAFRGFERRILVTENCRSWMQGGSPPEHLLRADSKIVRPILQEGIRPILQEGSKEEKPLSKEREEEKGEPAQNTECIFTAAASSLPIQAEALRALIAKARELGLTLEEWKTLVAKAQKDLKRKPSLTAASAMGWLLKKEGPDLVCRRSWALDALELQQVHQMLDTEFSDRFYRARIRAQVIHSKRLILLPSINEKLDYSLGMNSLIAQIQRIKNSNPLGFYAQ